MKIAVMIPCYNESLTIAKVVGDFRRELPEATIYVYDNNSNDGTGEIAARSGAVVKIEKRQGKGAVVRAMFRDLDADVYLMVDGDDTYPASDARSLIDCVVSGQADMAVGNRQHGGTYSQTQVRRFHSFGNSLVTRIINLLFQCQLADIMSGYRAFNRFYVKNCPILVNGFEIETIMTLHALDKLFKIVEIPIKYKDRPIGSVSKLSTYTDGFRVLRSIMWVFKDCKPMIFFLGLSVVSSLMSLAVGVPVLIEFVRTHCINMIPSAILASGLAIISLMLLVCGFILDTIVKIHREDFEVQLLNHYQDKDK